MNGRMYDPKLGRFLSPDNFIQDPYNTQSFNRFGYVWNNPLSHIDPDGEFLFIPFLIAAASGAALSAAIYTVSSLISGNFSLSGLGYSILGGAIQGMGAFFGPVGVVAGGILSSSVTTAIQGGSLGEIGQSALIGGISSIAGSEFSKFASKNIGTVLNGLKLNANHFISRTITGGIGGTAGGYASGFVTGAALTGNLREAHKYGVKGAGEGAKYGSISAGAGAIMDARKGDYNWWSGEPNKGSRAFFSGEGTEARAKEQGFQTLSETDAAKNLQKLIDNKNIPWEGQGNAEDMWMRLSKTWAKGVPNGASVPVFLNNPRPGSIWYKTELPILKQKGVYIRYK